MRKEITVRKIYTFSELSDAAKEKAREWFRSGNDFPWSDEYQDSLKAFADTFAIIGLDWRISPYAYSYCRGVVSSDAEEYSGSRLYKYLMRNFFDVFYSRKFLRTVKAEKINGIPGFYKGKRFKNRDGIEFVSLYSRCNRVEGDCPLTGFCADESLLDPIRKFLKNPSEKKTYTDLMQECLDSWASAYQDDIEYQDSEEAVDESIIANGYEFLENGKLA